ncbi:MAG: hypothetical protein ACM33T_09265 [Solirubrobacterales bacterium]
MAKVHVALAAALAASVSACAVPDRPVPPAPAFGGTPAGSLALVPEPLPPEVVRDRAALASLGANGTGSPEAAVARAFQPAAAVGQSQGGRSVALAALPRPVAATTRVAVHVPKPRPVAVAKAAPQPPAVSAPAVPVEAVPVAAAPAPAPAEQKRPSLLLALLQRLQMAIQ